MFFLPKKCSEKAFSGLKVTHQELKLNSHIILIKVRIMSSITTFLPVTYRC